MRSATSFAVLFLATLGVAQSPLRLIKGPLADVDPQVLGDFDGDGDSDMDVLTPWPRVVVNVTRQLAHRDFVRIGGTTTLDMYGTPGAPWFLYASPATGELATPYGAVLIDPASAQFIAAGTFAASTAVGAGTAALSFAIPSTPALVGLSLHWQGADLSVGRLTNRLTSTIRDF